MQAYRTTAGYLRRVLRSFGYHYDEFVDPGWTYYQALFQELRGDEPRIMELVRTKHPSSGVVAIALGLARERFDRLIISGFSFDLTHAHGRNPDIDERGTTSSKHAPTDIAVVNHLAQRYGNLYTTEPVVSEYAGIPLLAGDADGNAGP